MSYCDHFYSVVRPSVVNNYFLSFYDASNLDESLSEDTYRSNIGIGHMAEFEKQLHLRPAVH